MHEDIHLALSTDLWWHLPSNGEYCDMTFQIAVSTISLEMLMKTRTKLQSADFMFQASLLLHLSILPFFGAQYSGGDASFPKDQIINHHPFIQVCWFSSLMYEDFPLSFSVVELLNLMPLMLPLTLNSSFFLGLPFIFPVLHIMLLTLTILGCVFLKHNGSLLLWTFTKGLIKRSQYGETQEPATSMPQNTDMLTMYAKSPF